MSELTNFYQLRGSFGSGNHAGPKAAIDVADILDRMGAKPIFASRTHFSGFVGKYVNRLLWWVSCRVCRLRLPIDSIIFMSYPNETWSESASLCVLNEGVKHGKNLKLVTLINDLKSFHWAANVAKRSAENLTANRLERGEDRLCELFDTIIVHNEAMRQLLISCGVRADKIRLLEIFDYLTECSMPEVAEDNFRKVVYAGNLAAVKSPFVAKLTEISDCQFELFGPGFVQSSSNVSNINYNGCFPPEELPAHIKGGFGLVWDGGSIDEVAGPIGEYYKFIAPHKLSLYLSSGLPVIIWDKSGMADFVRKHGVGFCVSSLREVGRLLAGLSFGEYQICRAKAVTVGQQLRNGAYTRKAILGDKSEDWS